MKRIIVAALCALAACGGSVTAGSTPEATFEQMKNAAKSKNWTTLYGCVDPEGGDAFIFALAFGAEMLTTKDKDGAAELDALFKKHNYPKDAKIDLFGDKDKGRAAAKEALKGVSDRPGLFAGLMNLMEKYGKDKGNFQKELTDGTLKDLKIEGDHATARAVSADGQKSDRLSFVKRGSLWYFSLE